MQGQKFLFFLIGVLLCFSSLPVHVVTYEVNNGTSCNDGSCDPCCTIQAALSKAGPNDKIQVYSGTYNESVNLNNMGTPGNVTLMAVDGPGDSYHVSSFRCGNL